LAKIKVGGICYPNGVYFTGRNFYAHARINKGRIVYSCDRLPINFSQVLPRKTEIILLAWVLFSAILIIFRPFHLTLRDIPAIILMSMLILEIGKYIWVGNWHGAEHKAINAYEKNAKMSFRSVREQLIIHPNCGTTQTYRFFALVLVCALARCHWIFFVIFSILITISAFIPSLCLGLQVLTTREPTDQQIQAATKALKLLLKTERKAKAGYKHQTEEAMARLFAPLD
jgi:uncharacterized protein YqhQ